MAARLTEGSINRHLLTQTGPMMLGLISLMSVGLIDAYFIGQLGPDALAAAGLIFPATLTFVSLGVGIMVGINSVVSRAIGSGQEQRAEARAIQGILFAALMGSVLATLIIGFGAPLFRLLNASEITLPLILDYMFPYALSFPILLAGMACNGILRAQGYAMRASWMLLALATVNGILDPFLIFGIGPFPELGIAGAGWALFWAHLISTIMGLVMVCYGEIRMRARHCVRSDFPAGAREIARIGGPAALANAVNPFGLLVLSAILAQLSQDAVAAFGAAQRIQSFINVPLLALSAAIGGIIGQNWGALHSDRVMEAMRSSVLFCLGYGVLMAVILTVLREPLAGLFSRDAQVVGQMSAYFLIAAWGYAGFGVVIVINGALNAIGRSGLSLLLSAGRVALIMVPLGLASLVFGGPDTVYGAELIANLTGGAMSALLAWRVLGARQERHAASK